MCNNSGFYGQMIGAALLFIYIIQRRHLVINSSSALINPDLFMGEVNPDQTFQDKIFQYTG